MTGLPTTFVLDGAGRIAMTLRGPQTGALRCRARWNASNTADSRSPTALARHNRCHRVEEHTMSENRDGPDDVLLLGGDAQDFGRFYALHEDYVAHAVPRTGRLPRSSRRTWPRRRSPARSSGTQELRPAPAAAPRGWLTGIARHVLADELQAWEGRGHAHGASWGSSGCRSTMPR